MDLHTGTPVWRADGTPPLQFPTLQGEANCEVAVIGGGITGALLSYLLVKAGVDTVLVDKRTPGEGSTVGSTGLLQYEVDTPLVDLIQAVGEERAVHAYRRGISAIDELEQLVKVQDDACGFSRRNSLYFASKPEHVKDLKQEYECRKYFGFDVEILSQRELSNITTIRAPAAIWSRGDAQINPYHFTQSLLAKSRQSGVRIFCKSSVTSIDESTNGITLTTSDGIIRCRAVIFATGYEAHQQLPGSPGSLKSTYALASEPLETFNGWPEGCLVWETARPYSYARQTYDGRVIIGGEDTEYSEDHTFLDLLAEKSRKLIARFADLFPQIPLVPSYAWGGTFAETKDGLAYIGQVRPSSKVYAALGYGGNGITFSAIAARLLVDLFLGRPNADASVFSFDR